MPCSGVSLKARQKVSVMPFCVSFHCLNILLNLYETKLSVEIRLYTGRKLPLEITLSGQSITELFHIARSDCIF